MDICVLVEPLPDRRFRASTGAPWQVECSAETADDAVAGVKHQIAAHLQAGAQVHKLTLPTEEHPLARYAGSLANDPMLPEFLAAIEEYRRMRDPDDYQ